jgi:hypothetical protein
MVAEAIDWDIRSSGTHTYRKNFMKIQRTSPRLLNALTDCGSRPATMAFRASSRTYGWLAYGSTPAEARLRLRAKVRGNLRKKR